MTNRDILDELRVRGELAERLKRMAPRYREIITLRYGLSFETGQIVRGEMTMEQVAKLYSITNERVRQIEGKVFKELSEGLTDSPWQTGTPTEEGNYIAHLRIKSRDGEFIEYDMTCNLEVLLNYIRCQDESEENYLMVKGWLRYEPYKED